MATSNFGELRNLVATWGIDAEKAVWCLLLYLYIYV
jgi:hypothetical protein